MSDARFAGREADIYNTDADLQNGEGHEAIKTIGRVTSLAVDGFVYISDIHIHQSFVRSIILSRL